MDPREFLRQLWSGQRAGVAAVTGLLLANLGLVLLLSLYLVPEVNARHAELQQRQAELRGEQVSEDSPVRLLDDALRDLASFNEQIAPYREFTGLLNELQELADLADLEIGQIAYKPETDKNSALLRYTLNFTLVGSYREIKQFIHALEQSQRLIVLRQVSLQGVSGDESDNDVRLQLSLETFFRPGTT